jgi:hypothetical protein
MIRVLFSADNNEEEEMEVRGFCTICDRYGVLTATRRGKLCPSCEQAYAPNMVGFLVGLASIVGMFLVAWVAL